MNYNVSNIPHQYRSPYWYGDYKTEYKGLNRVITEYTYIFGEFRFDSNTGLIYSVYED